LGLSNAQLFELSIQEYKKNQVNLIFYSSKFYRRFDNNRSARERNKRKEEKKKKKAGPG
jgi:hypothetical protein